MFSKVVEYEMPEGCDDPNLQNHLAFMSARKEGISSCTVAQ